MNSDKFNSEHVQVVKDPLRSDLLGLAGVDARRYAVLRRRGTSYVLRSECVDRTLGRCVEHKKVVTFDVTPLIRVADLIVDSKDRVVKHRTGKTHPEVSLRDLR